MLKPEYTSQFKKDYKLAVKRGLNPDKLTKVILLLCYEEKLSEIYRDHALKDCREYKDVRECHIESDWLLIYRVKKSFLILELIRTGSHSDLFE